MCAIPFGLVFGVSVRMKVGGGELNDVALCLSAICGSWMCLNAMYSSCTEELPIVERSRPPLPLPYHTITITISIPFQPPKFFHPSPVKAHIIKTRSHSQLLPTPHAERKFGFPEHSPTKYNDDNKEVYDSGKMMESILSMVLVFFVTLPASESFVATQVSFIRPLSSKSSALFSSTTDRVTDKSGEVRTSEVKAVSAIEEERWERIGRKTRTYREGSIVDQGKNRYPTALDLIGNTPLVDLTPVANPKNPESYILGKVEFFNPGYSMKDRITANIFKIAEDSGELKPGMTVVAASSGNTGCSVAMMCAMKNYKAVIITNEKCSEEKRQAIRAYGAELIIAPKGKCYMQMETDLATENPSWFSVDQYNNLNNPEGHYRSTGPEIWAQTNGDVTHFVAAGSTGGTISGIGTFLKENKPSVKVILADPSGSVFKNYFKTGELGPEKPFLVEGVGKNNIPGSLDLSVVDGVVEVSDNETMSMCRKIAKKTGICAGGSSGLNVEAAKRIVEESEEPVTVVTILCDSGIKYLSKVYNDQWMEENGFVTEE